MDTTTADSLLAVARSLVVSARSANGELADAYARRAISTAYYAVFHLLLQAVEEELRNTVWSSLAPQVVRRVDHGKLAKVAGALDADDHRNRKGFKDLMQWQMWRDVFEGPNGEEGKPNAPVRRFGLLVALLQKARHDADYNRGKWVHGGTAETRVVEAEEAVTLWREKVKGTPLGAVFLLSLLDLEGRPDRV